VSLDLYFKNILVLFAAILFCGAGASAKDYGKQGNTFEIQEQDLLEVIQDRLKEIDAEKWQNDFKQRVVRSVHRPAPTRLPYARENQIRYHDPSITLQRDHADNRGFIFAKKGTKINPLEKASLASKLVFINGDSRVQLNWALERHRENKGLTKIILLDGAVIDLMNETNVRLYFDQKGLLARKFNLQNTPALISQENNLLKIEEVALDYE
jgi:conjugal transfer pilus assembly protein TraW